MNTTARVLLLVIVPGLLVAAASVVGMLLTTDLPSPLAVHWGVDGAVDRLGGIDSYVLIVALLVPLFVAGVAGFSIAPLRRGASRLFVRTVVGLAGWFSVFLSVSMFLGVQSQRGVVDAATLPLSTALAPLAAGFGIAVVVAALLVLAAPRVPQPEPLEAPIAGEQLADGERVYWARSVHSPRGVIAIPVAVIVLIAVLFAIVGLPIWATLLVALVLAALMTMLTWHVVVDRRGITVTGLFGFPRFQVPLQKVTGAAAVDVVALRDFGGWGVRFGRTGWGVIARSGSAIEVHRGAESSFLVTVDDAETGARLLAAMALRAREG